MASSSTELATVDAEEELALTFKQAVCPVVHRFGPGIYIREVFVPAGAFAVSHCHRFEHVNIHLAGVISMRDGDGDIYVSQAPRFYIGQPGRKRGVAITDVVWQNIFATDETDVETLEAMLFDKSAAFLELAQQVREAESMTREADRNDFHMILDEIGMTPYQARALSVIETDQIPMPPEAGANVVIRRSAIEGQGVFVQTAAKAGDVIAPARIRGKRTPAGRYANHSRTPNAKFVAVGGDAILVAIAAIAPFCSETVPGDEVTVDYRQALGLAGRLV